LYLIDKNNKENVKSLVEKTLFKSKILIEIKMSDLMGLSIKMELMRLHKYNRGVQQIIKAYI